MTLTTLIIDLGVHAVDLWGSVFLATLAAPVEDQFLTRLLADRRRLVRMALDTRTFDLSLGQVLTTF